MGAPLITGVTCATSFSVMSWCRPSASRTATKNRRKNSIRYALPISRPRCRKFSQKRGLTRVNTESHSLSDCSLRVNSVDHLSLKHQAVNCTAACVMMMLTIPATIGTDHSYPLLTVIADGARAWARARARACAPRLRWRTGADVRLSSGARSAGRAHLCDAMRHLPPG